MDCASLTEIMSPSSPFRAWPRQVRSAAARVASPSGAGVAVVVDQRDEDADTFVQISDSRSQYVGEELVETGEACARRRAQPGSGDAVEDVEGPLSGV